METRRLLAAGTTSGDVLADETWCEDTVITGELRIAPGVTVTVDPDVLVTIEQGANITVDGTLDINAAQAISFEDGSRFSMGASNLITVRSGGLLTADDTRFDLTADDTDVSGVVVNSGGAISMVGSVVAIDQVFLEDGSLIAAGGITGNEFSATVSTPISHLLDGGANLKSNLRFGEVEIISGQVVRTGETLVLNPLGTQTNTNMRYQLNSLTIDPGGQLDIVADTRVLLNESATLVVDGELNILEAESFTIADGSQFSDGSINSVLVRDGGKLLATGTHFNRSAEDTDRAALIIESGARVGLVDNVFDLDDVFFADGSVVGSSDVIGNQFNNVVFAPVDLLLDTNANIKSNRSFEEVHVLPGQSVRSGQSLSLDLLGTVETAGMRYVLDDLVINSGGRLTIGQDVNVLLQQGGVIDVDGVMEIAGATSFAVEEGSPFTLGALNAIRVRNGGMFIAADTRIEQIGDGGDRTALISDPGSTISISDSFYGLEELSLTGDAATILRNDIDSIVTVDGGVHLDFYLNDLSDLPGENSGLVAVGDPAATLDFGRNYWGTTVVSEIEQLILDRDDDASRPDVVFDPFLLQPNPVPDYAAVAMSVDASPLIAGGIADISYNVRNFSGVGNASSTSVVAFFLTIGNSSSESLLLGFDNVPALAASTETGARSVALSLPEASDPIWSQGLPADYTIRMLVDATDAIAEFDETNNWISTDISVSPTVATVVQTGQTTMVSEDGVQDTFSVQLSLTPDADVTIRATPDPQLDLGNGPGVAVDLLFSPATATTPIEVSLSAIDDLAIEGLSVRQIEFDISSNDPRFDDVKLQPLAVEILDNDSVKVTDLEINGGQIQRSTIDQIRVSFNTEVNLSFSAIDLRNVTTGETIGVVVATDEVIDARTVATLGFDRMEITDGNYEIVLRSAEISAKGIPLDGNADGTAGGDYVDEFFRFYGDSDGDRDVDGQDYGRFGLTFLRSAGEAGYDPSYDSDYDGDVDGQDYGRFGLRFLKSLTP